LGTSDRDHRLERLPAPLEVRLAREREGKLVARAQILWIRCEGFVVLRDRIVILFRVEERDAFLNEHFRIPLRLRFLRKGERSDMQKQNGKYFLHACSGSR